MMLKPHSWFMMILLSLGACTTTEIVTDIPFHTATPRPIVTEPGIDEAVLSNFERGAPIALGEPPVFNFGVSGDFIEQTSTGIANYSLLSATDRLPPRNQLYFSSSGAASSQELTFILPTTIEVGQYNLLSPANYYAGSVTAAYARLAFNGTQTRVQSFSENIVGILTITDAQGALSGHFQFSADAVETFAGESSRQTVQITGSFEYIPYQLTQDALFENVIPLPTRNFELATATPRP